MAQILDPSRACRRQENRAAKSSVRRSGNGEGKTQERSHSAIRAVERLSHAAPDRLGVRLVMSVSSMIVGAGKRPAKRPGGQRGGVRAWLDQFPSPVPDTGGSVPLP